MTGKSVVGKFDFIFASFLSTLLRSSNFSTGLLLNCTETDVADILTTAQTLFSDVNIGSYPQWSNNYTKGAYVTATLII